MALAWVTSLALQSLCPENGAAGSRAQREAEASPAQSQLHRMGRERSMGIVQDLRRQPRGGSTTPRTTAWSAQYKLFINKLI